MVLSELANAGSDPWASKSSWRMNQKNLYHYDFQVGEDTHHVEIEPIKDQLFIHLADQTISATATLDSSTLTATLNGHKQTVTVAKQDDGYVIFGQDGANVFNIVKPDCGEGNETIIGGDFTAPMNGTIVEVLVNTNDNVSKGQALIIIEAMKMQHTMQAPSDGVVSELFCTDGDLVDGGAVLLDFTPAELAS
jgi:3-methylcrotonyl-CoA carboxylase alpha subunit